MASENTLREHLVAIYLKPSVQSTWQRIGEEKADEAMQAFTAAVETVKPKKVPAGPVDTSDDAINSIPWETGWNNCVDEFDQRLAEMVGKQDDEFNQNYLGEDRGGADFTDG